MIGEITIDAGEFAIVRVFQLSDGLARQLADAPGLAPLARALGVETLNPDHVQVTALRTLDDLGLAGLLEQGHGVAPTTLAPDARRLSELTGTVAILRSRAFDGAVTLHPSQECPLIATYAEEGAPPPRMTPLHSTGAAGNLDSAPDEGMAPDYRASRRTLLIALALAVALMLIVLALGRGAS